MLLVVLFLAELSSEDSPKERKIMKIKIGQFLEKAYIYYLTNYSKLRIYLRQGLNGAAYLSNSICLPKGVSGLITPFSKAINPLIIVVCIDDLKVVPSNGDQPHLYNRSSFLTI